jgi:hypothetical protein
MLNFQTIPVRIPLFLRLARPAQSAMFRVAAVAVALCGFFAPESAAQSPRTFNASATFVVPKCVEFIDIYVSNVITPVGPPSQIFKIDPVSGALTVFASAGNLIYPTGRAVEEDGSAVVVVDALSRKVVSIKIPAGTRTGILSDAQSIQPTHIAIEKTGDYFVTDGKPSSFSRRLFRVDKGTGTATEISITADLNKPEGYPLRSDAL